MDSFEDYLKELDGQKAAQQQRKLEAEKALESRLNLFEHKVYKDIPGTNSSYREDSANTNTKTLKHAHVYARRNGSGQELYSINVDGRGHDGSSGVPISAKHGDYFRSIGYAIPLTNILECLDLATISHEDFCLISILDSSDDEES